MSNKQKFFFLEPRKDILIFLFLAFTPSSLIQPTKSLQQQNFVVITHAKAPNCVGLKLGSSPSFRPANAISAAIFFQINVFEASQFEWDLIGH